jgi:glycosyltransferase involved in cell wall biosynthesis
LAAAIRKAITLPADARAAMADKAMKHVQNKFDIQHMCDKTLSVYGELLKAL